MADLWSSSLFHIFLGLVAGLIFVFWDWRIALPGLLVVQLGIGGIVGIVYALPGPWPAVHVGVMFLSCLILLLSILQTSHVLVNHAGEFSSVLFRSLLLGFAALLVLIAGESAVLPSLRDATKLLFIWIAVLAILTLGLTEKALFGGIALLLWLIPVQAYLSILFPLPALNALLGILQLLAALACSYLHMAEDEVLSTVDAPVTDSGLASGRPRRLGIVAGARILWYGIAYRFYSLISRLQPRAPRSR